MTVKELIDRLNELNSPDKEVVIGDGININGVSFSDVGNKIVLNPSLNIKGLYDLVSDLRDCYYDIDDVLDKLMNVTEELEELVWNL